MTRKRRHRAGRGQPYDYEQAFNQQMENLSDLDARRTAAQGIRYAAKEIRAGTQLEVEIYPEFPKSKNPYIPTDTQRESQRRAQRNLNEKNSRKQCERILNANFGSGDLWATFTYTDDCMPASMDEALKNMQNFIRRLNYQRKKRGLKNARYVYVTEGTQEGRWHHHVVLDGDMDMDTVERLWIKGKRNQVRRLDADENGLTGMAKYGAVNGDTTKISFIELNGSWLSSPSPSGFPKTATIDGKVYRWTIQETAEAFGDTYVKKAKLNIGQSFLVINKPFFTIECGGKTGTYSFYDLGKLESGWLWDPEASDIEIDGKQKVPINIEDGTGIKLSTDAKYRFTWSLGNRSYNTTKSITAGKTRIETSYQVPKEWNDQITAAQSGTMYLKIESIFGTHVYQSMTAYIYASVPDDCVPVINSITVADKRGRVPAAWKMFIQDQSNVALTAMDVSISYGSAIKSVVMEVGGREYAGTTDSLPASGTFKDYGVVDITVTVTDGRGRTAEKTAKITVVEYSPPTLSVDSMRCGSDGSIENEGVYFLAMTDSTWSGCNGKNVPTLTIAYKLTSERSYRTPKSVTPGEGVTTVCGGDLDTEFSYDVQYILKDAFNTVTVIDYVSTAVYLMHFLHGGRGVAFGSKATMENYADFAFNAIFRGTCEFEKPNGETVTIAQIIEKLGL